MLTDPQQLVQARAVWRTCLASAFRTTLACAIVAIVILRGPAVLQSEIAYSTFSFVTAILIVTDATLGDALHGCWLVLYTSVQSQGPAMLSLWLIGPANLMKGTTALAVGLGALVVALPESTPMTAKRIAFGQIVLSYVAAYIKGGETQPIMHPVRVAISTAVGGMACVLALLLPYPRLACCEVSQTF